MTTIQLSAGRPVMQSFGLGLALLAYSVGAIAQVQAPPPPAAGKPDQTSLAEIVVTGTLIRGATAVGSNVIVVDPAAVVASGAATTDQLLSTVPQVTNLFNNVPDSRLNVAPNQIQVVRPNLRNLSPETGSSSSTLVLFDGHRVAGVGVTQSAVDPDLIPVGAIERVEVVTDGGSATYGADAVGGVINFITRKHFDGLEVGAHTGFAGSYHTNDANATVGKDWGSGSLLGSFMYQQNDPLFGRDRPWIRQVDWSTPTRTPTGRACNPGNVTLPGAFSFKTFTFGPSTTYGLPNLTTPGFNACDLTRDSSFVPQTKHFNALVGLRQDLNDHAVTLDAQAYYGQRTTTSYAPQRGQSAVAPTSAFYEPAAANPLATQTVGFTFAPVLGGESATSGTRFKEWGANLDIVADLNDNWRARTLLNYSASDSLFYIIGLNQNLLSAAGSASDPQAAVNFYNPAATPNLNVIRTIANSEITGQSLDTLLNARVIVDGRLFTLPGGDVRIAAGYEYLHDNFQQRVAPPNAVLGAISSIAYTPYGRTDQSAFGELQLPVFGEGNRMRGIYSLTEVASVRYDHYSDFGATTNYKIGLTYKPIEKLALRGNYSTSFNAPSPVDQLGSLRNTISFFPFNAFVRPGDTPSASGTLALQGSAPNLVPQTAKTYSFGADMDPTAEVHGSVSYYHVDFKDILGIPTPNPGIFTDFPNNVTTNVNGLSAAQLQAFAKLAPNGSSVTAPLIAANYPVYELVQFLAGNYGELKVSGLDFAASYRHSTGFGAFDTSVAGNYTLDRTSKISATSPVVNVLDYETSRLQLQASVGADFGHFRAQATLNHTSGYNVQTSSSLPQDHVGDFNTVNLFFEYGVHGDSPLLKNLRFTLNVNNVFDTAPPQYRLNTGNGYENGFTLGRLVMFGVSEKL